MEIIPVFLFLGLLLQLDALRKSRHVYTVLLSPFFTESIGGGVNKMKEWKGLYLFILFFAIAYFAYLYFEITGNYMIDIKTLTSLVFFAGAGFVWLVVDMDLPFRK